MRRGFLDLSKILKFAEERPTLPCGRNQEFRQYSKLCDAITLNIPETSGWYFWISSKNEKWGDIIYIGKADRTSKKNSLRYRINYELKTERICFWVDVVGEEKAFNDQHIFFNGRYDKKSKRDLKKAGAKFIVWISDSDVAKHEAREVERILIDQYKPRVNVQRAQKNRAFEKAKSVSALFRGYAKRF